MPRNTCLLRESDRGHGFAEAIWLEPTHTCVSTEPEYLPLPDTSAKCLYEVSQRLLGADVVRPTPGRQQIRGARDYATVFDVVDFSAHARWAGGHDFKFSASNDQRQSQAAFLESSELNPEHLQHYVYNALARIMRLWSDNNQPEAQRSLERLTELIAASRKTKPTSVILEEFIGFVEHVQNGVAFVALESEHGDTMFGSYSAESLRERGIGERQRFHCRTLDNEGRVSVEFEPIPEADLSDEDQRTIQDSIDQILAIDPLDSDY